ncbi:SgcJ/EcaC family oxidoreductase [Streptomyces sp. SP17KL33]|uniref:SgcJ/EcaC family oxidoreductase n=1 Tax=Streptomyces sp. SP17KL33 TaxID=3002534 RepID=UPI002E76DBB7|nr:SgcJ/EcaC family oxidoreductase [Streptomyces sp. SP17KL33]MEE1837976.1 SgcJ/EcaC family oxidoreductase [Streptomyces sp. SP17KL33]
MDTTNSTLPANDADERRIRELVARSQEAQIDPDVLPALHTSNLVIVNLAGRRLFGRGAFASAMAEALSSPLKDIRTSLEVDDIRFTTPDVAIVSLTKTVHDERSEAEGSSELPSVGVMTYVLTRQGDDWRIALAQTTPVG